MRTFYGILILGGLIALVMMWRWLQAKALARVTRVVRGKTHRQGQDEVHTVMTWRIPGARDQARDQVIATVNAYSEPPALIAGLHLAQHTKDELIYRYGNRVSDRFVVRVRFDPDHGGHGGGGFHVLHWLECDGLIEDHERIADLRSRVQAAVEKLHGTVGFHDQRDA